MLHFVDRQPGNDPTSECLLRSGLQQPLQLLLFGKCEGTHYRLWRWRLFREGGLKVNERNAIPLDDSGVYIRPPPEVEQGRMLEQAMALGLGCTSFEPVSQYPAPLCKEAAAPHLTQLPRKCSCNLPSGRERSRGTAREDESNRRKDEKKKPESMRNSDDSFGVTEAKMA
mmetsp:Transcript_63317/g.151048  ORF Transcript_63317/g.151048 Transcript_63317/m.151048 type:complete len:170 (-) Transcript_63317:6-515(-)